MGAWVVKADAGTAHPGIVEAVSRSAPSKPEWRAVEEGYRKTPDARRHGFVCSDFARGQVAMRMDQDGDIFGEAINEAGEKGRRHRTDDANIGTNSPDMPVTDETADVTPKP